MIDNIKMEANKNDMPYQSLIKVYLADRYLTKDNINKIIMKPQEVAFKNGLQVIFVDTKTFPTLTTFLLVGASRYETENNGAIFLNMAFRRSKISKFFRHFLDGRGIRRDFNAFTSKIIRDIDKSYDSTL